MKLLAPVLCLLLAGGTACRQEPAPRRSSVTTGRQAPGPVVGSSQDTVAAPVPHGPSAAVPAGPFTGPSAAGGTAPVTTDARPAPMEPAPLSARAAFITWDGRSLQGDAKFFLTPVNQGTRVNEQQGN